MNEPKPRFDVWIPAVDAGYLRLAELVGWADEQVRALDHPPQWLLELSGSQGAAALRSASQHVPEQGSGRSEGERPVDLYLGFLYLAYEQSRIPLSDYYVGLVSMPTAAAMTWRPCPTAKSSTFC